MRLFVRRLISCALFAAVLASCGSGDDQLSEELVEQTQTLVAERLAGASVELGPADAECVARRLSDDNAIAFAAAADEQGVSAELADTVANEVLSCVDVEQLAQSAVAPLTVGVSEESSACVADSVDAELTHGIIAANLEGVGLPAAQLELKLASALGFCLTADELLDRG